MIIRINKAAIIGHIQQKIGMIVENVSSGIKFFQLLNFFYDHFSFFYLVSLSPHPLIFGNSNKS